MSRKRMATTLIVVGFALMLAMAYFFESTAGAGVGVLVAALGFVWLTLMEPGQRLAERLSGRWSADERTRLRAAQGGKCRYCGVRLDSAYMEVDHKVPLSRGGSNDRRNLQLLCGPCNRRKGRATDAEFRLKYGIRSKAPPSKVIPQQFFERPRSGRSPKRSPARGRR